MTFTVERAFLIHLEPGRVLTWRLSVRPPEKKGPAEEIPYEVILELAAPVVEGQLAFRF